MYESKRENRTLEILLKIFLIAGIVAAIAIVAKILYDKYKEKLCLLCEDDMDCNFECLDDEGLSCDCETCEYSKANKEDEITEESEEA